MKTRRNKQTAVFLAVFLLSCLGITPANKNAQADVANHIVINEVFIDSVVGTGGTDDDWVELFNPIDSEISLEGWSIQKTAGTGGSVVRQPLSGSIGSGAYILIVRDGATTAQNLKDQADILASNSFSLASGNVVYLVNNNENIEGASDVNIVDLVGFGAATIFEGLASAPTISETKSITRFPEGEDTNENSVDFILLDVPTPESTKVLDSSGLSGSVLLTLTKNLLPVQNISPTSADIVFQINTEGSAIVNYGLDTGYTNVSAPVILIANTDASVSLAGLECGKIYHYNIVAENTAGTESDQALDDVFETLPCGINLDSLAMTKSSAKANDQYNDGWIWEFYLTVWNMDETSLKMKFDVWGGNGSLDAGGNMQFSVDDGLIWHDIDGNDSYPTTGADLAGLDLSTDLGRQIKVLVRMKIPKGTLAGNYTSGYGILTE